MATSDPETLEKGLPKIHRYITTTSKETNKSHFSTAIPTPSFWDNSIETISSFLAYTTRIFPISLLHSSSPSAATPDISSYQQDIVTPPGISISNGTVLRYADLAPGTESPMHRTKSLDYGIVIEGKVELTLDSGEKRVLNRGDCAVQRGTWHVWRNVTEDGGWARVAFVLVGAEGDGLDGEGFKDNLEIMEGWKRE